MSAEGHEDYAVISTTPSSDDLPLQASLVRSSAASSTLPLEDINDHKRTSFSARQGAAEGVLLHSQYGRVNGDLSSLEAQEASFGREARVGLATPIPGQASRAHGTVPPKLEEEPTKMKGREALTTLSILLEATATNGSFYSQLCNGPDLSLYDAVTITPINYNAFYETPSCLASAVTIKSITSYNLLIPTFAVLPSSMQSLFCSNCRVGPPAATMSTEPSVAAPYSASTATDFDADGNIVWEQLWSRFPSLSSFLMISANFKGSIPSSIPEAMTKLSLDMNEFSLGQLSSSFFSRFNGTAGLGALSFSFRSCGLTGSIPADFFTSLTGRRIAGLQFNVNDNSISGPIPPNLFNPLQASSSISFFFYISNNLLTGTIPPYLFPSGIVAPNVGALFYFEAESNKLEGTIPEGLLSVLTGVRAVTFKASDNLLNGTLPSVLFNGDTWKAPTSQLSISLARNMLTGTIHESLLTSSLQTNNVSLGYLGLDLSGNRLTGTISPRLFSADARILKRDAAGSNHGTWSSEAANDRIGRDASTASHTRSSKAAYAIATFSAITLSVDLSNNLLNGTIPNNLLDNLMQSISQATVALDGNLLTGSFPNTLANAYPSPVASNAWLTVSASRNRLTGNVPTNCNSLSMTSYNLYGNRLNGTFATTGISTCQSLTLNVSMNINLNASIPTELFNISTMKLYASYTNFSGAVPPSMTSTSASLDLSFTSVDFCTSPLSAYSAFYAANTCKLDATSAACSCPSNYGMCSLVCDAPMMPIAPYSDEDPLPPSTTPQPSTAPPTTGCDPKTRPSPEFTCINNAWTATSTSSPVLTIPSGAGVVVVEGNVSSSTIVINGIGSKIVIGGCASNLSSIVIELSPEQVKQLESTKSLQTLLALSGDSTSCTRNLSDVALNTRTSGCRKVSTEKVVSENTLGAYFMVNSGGCNRWWIILVSVIAGVVVVAVVVAIVSRVVWQHHRSNKAKGKLAQVNG